MATRTLTKVLSLLLTVVLSVVILSSCKGNAGGVGNGDNGGSGGSGERPKTGTVGEAPSSQLGLYVENGKVMLGGKEFYGIGTNYHDAAFRYVTNPLCDDIDVGLENLVEHKIPYIRVRFSSYGGEGMDTYKNDPVSFYRELDKCVEFCEKYNIGIIAVVVWTTLPYNNPDKEPLNNFFSTPDGQGFKDMVNYVKDIVNRYKNSPAIWGWEIGNEFNLACNVAPHNLDPEIAGAFIEYMANVIRKEDGSRRCINHGNSQNRWASYHLWKQGVWDYDTRDQIKEMLEIYDSENIDITSTHVYNLEQYDGYAQTATIEEYLKYIGDFCKEMGKPLYVGEYCDDEPFESMDVSKQKFRGLHDAVVNAGVQLGTIWYYDNYTDGYATKEEFVQYMLGCAKEANEKYIADKKQDTASYWSNVKKVFCTEK